MAIASGSLKVQGLDCPTEEARIRLALESWPGLVGLDFDLEGGIVHLRFENERTELDALAQGIQSRCGYGCSIASEAVVSGMASAESCAWLWSRGRWAILAAVAGLAGFAASHQGADSSGRVGYAVSIGFSAVWILPKAIDAVRRGRLDIFTLVALAIAGAAALGQWDEAATVGVLFGVSEILESYAARRARISIQALIDLAPERAEKIEGDGTIRTVDPSILKPGDMVLVRPGQKIPVDGLIREGASHVDQAIVTGESIPVTVQPGSDIFAGSVNGEGVLTVETTKLWGENVVQRIAKRVQEARATRAQIERLVDRFAQIYTPAVVLIALLVAVAMPVFSILAGRPGHWGVWFERGLVLLVIACPCALVIATPVAIVSALANAAKHGILVRDGGVIERFGQLKLMAFDKTGTLTMGHPDVIAATHLFDASGVDAMLTKAAAIGRDGSHVVSKAILRHVRERDLDIPEATRVSEHPGLGTSGLVREEHIHMGSHRYLDQAGLCDARFHDQLVALENEVGTAVAIANENGPLGWIRLEDRPRHEAAMTIDRLKRLGLRTIMVTGDNHATATSIATTLGIDEIAAGLMPEEKANIVQTAVRTIGPVGMVGDGINDAPALAAASVGICMGTVAGAVTNQAADVVLVNDNLMSLTRMVALSRRTVSVIRSNVAFALVTKVLVLILAVCGFAGFWLAMAADVGVSLIVVAHAMTLLRFDTR